MDYFVGLKLAYAIQIPLVIKYFLQQWIWTEIIRSFSILLLPMMSISMHLATLDNVQTLPATRFAIRKNIQLQVIDRCGDQAFRQTAETLVTVGYRICVVGLWIVLQGWKMFPVPVYGVANGTTFARLFFKRCHTL